jgi:putative sigma-54 modulation protein
VFGIPTRPGPLHSEKYQRGEASVQINISARHGHLGSQIQQTIIEKVERVTKFYDRITSIHVTADLKDSTHPEVELVIKAEHHDDFVASDRAETLLTAVDSVVHKIEMQLRKHKEKLTEHRATGHKHMEVTESESES